MLLVIQFLPKAANLDLCFPEGDLSVYNMDKEFVHFAANVSDIDVRPSQQIHQQPTYLQRRFCCCDAFNDCHGNLLPLQLSDRTLHVEV